jgi:hypothetical protein
MPHLEPFPSSEYSEDTTGSEEYARLSSPIVASIGRHMKIAAVIFWLPWILWLIGVIPKLSPQVFVFSVGGGLAIVIWGFLRSGMKGKSLFSLCSNCGSHLRKESHQQCDFYVCDSCKTFVRGGDFS